MRLEFKSIALSELSEAAICFPDGDDPISADIKIDGHAGWVVVDGEGVCVDWHVEDIPYTCSLEGIRATRAVAQMQGEMKWTDLRKLGFEPERVY